MITEIPGFRYDVTIKNYVPILHDTPGNRALNLITASKIIKFDNLNTIKRQIKNSKHKIINFRRNNYPKLSGSIINLSNINKYQQIGTNNIKSKKIISEKIMNFPEFIKADFDENDTLSTYHSIYKCFPPDYNSQIIMSSYSSSPFLVHHSLFQLNYSNYQNDSTVSVRSHLIKHFDNLGGIKQSVNEKKIVLLNKKEFCLINKEDTSEIRKSKFSRELPLEMRCAFDASDKLLIGVHSKKRMTYLASFDLSSNEGRYESFKCDWERKWVFNDIVYDIYGANVFLSLRGRLSNSSECILHYDFRSPIPSEKNIRRNSLNFHQNSYVNLTRVPNYSELIVTHGFDGKCALWDMRWKDRPAAIYQNISPGRSGLPIDIDPTSRFITVTDSENVVRIFNLKTGLVLYTEQQPLNTDCSSNVYSFYSENSLHCRPTLISNFNPNTIHVKRLRF